MAEPRDERTRLAAEIEHHVRCFYAETHVGSINVPMTRNGWAAVIAAPRSPGLDRDGEGMREACVAVCDRRIESLEALGSANKTECTRAALYELRAAGGQIRALAHEEKAGC